MMMTKHSPSARQFGAGLACALFLGFGAVATSCQDSNAALSEVQQKKRASSRPKKAASRPSDTDAKARKFMRWVKTGKTEGRYETSIARYQDKTGRIVDLISVVHIGDADYYEDLEQRFKAYDALLYELVAPKGARPSKLKSGGSLISQIQRMMKTSLNLQFQLDAIDYEASNFVHADLSPKEFLAKQKERGESMVTLMIRAMLAGMQQQKSGESTPITGFHLLMGMNNPNYLKFLFAQQLEQVEALLAALGGGKGEKSTIVGDRNAAAIEVMREQLEKGKRKLGIFYGAAHMPDLEDRLLGFGFEFVSSEWLTAWDVTLSDEERARRDAIERKKAERREKILERRRKRALEKAAEKKTGDK